MDRGAGEKLVPIQITVLRGKNMGVNKGESVLNFVRAEFNSIILGESQKLNASADQTLEYNFTCSFDCFGETNTLDDLAHKPVVLTAVEILPKEHKKQKEEKTTVLGQGVVDLLPLLHGQRSFTSMVVLHPSPGSPAESASQEDNSKPSLDVTICATEPLLSDAQLSSSNLLRVLVEAAYAVPDVWSPAAPASYVVGFQVPQSAEKEQVLLFSKGLLKTGGEREPLPRLKKWPLGPILAPGADCIPGAFIEADPIEMESGELTGMEDRDFRTEAEVSRKRVCWDTERRCFLDARAVAYLTQRITHCRLWPVEIGRVPQTGLSRGGKPARDKVVEDEAQVSFHGVAYVDLAPLLYPGVRRLHGAYSLHPFYEADMQDKTKRSTSVLREGVRQLLQQGGACPPPSTGSAQCRTASGKIIDKGAKGPKEATKKPGIQEKSLLPENSTDVDTLENVEGQMYTEARTYIVIEIALEKPLVPKRPPEELAKRVRELIAARPLHPRRPAGAERAVQQYQDQVASVAALLLEQYQQLFGHALASGSHQLDPTAQEERKTQFIGELNYSGKYFAFKEQLKNSVVRIVREKMLRTEPFRDQEQLQAFLSQLYVFLVDEMHVALNKTFLADPQDDPPPSQIDCTQLRHFAQEAQLNQDYQLAATFYQERLARDQRNPEHWFDYGVFHMLTRDYLKAEECFREAVSISPVHLPSLLMCGILAEMAGRTEEAQTYMEGATCVDPTSVVAWTLSGLFYEGQEDTIQAEMAFLEANAQLRAAVAGTRSVEREFGAKAQEEQESGSCDSPTTIAEGDGEKTQSIQGIRAVTPRQKPSTPQSLCTPLRPSTSIYMETAHFLLENNVLQMAQRALAQELLCPGGGPRCSYHLALARLQLMSREFSSAETSLQEALKDDIESPDTWAWLGHLHYLKGNYSQAQECYERTLDFVKDAADPHAVYLRLGQIYLQGKQFEKAKITYLQACKSSASCLSWLGVGAACYRLGELTEAEDALTEANALNNTDAEVWGYLSLVCLQTGRQLQAEQTYKYAMKLNLQKETLLQEIKDLQAQVGFGNPCF